MEYCKTLNINESAKEIKEWRLAHGFYTPSSLKTVESKDMMLGKLMLVVTEVGEAAEAVRHGDEMNFIEEIADTFIRLMDITAAMKIDIDGEIRRKMAVNHNRPYKHGKLTTL